MTIAASTFGIEPASARDLGSERDQAFLLTTADGLDAAILKVSNAAEDPGTLDMEALAAQHVHRVDPGLGVALPWLSPGAEAAAGAPAHRARFAAADGEHWVRAYDVLPGASRVDPVSLSDRALIEWGATTARLGRAMRGFFHPKAQRTMLWDVQHALDVLPMLDDVGDPEDARGGGAGAGPVRGGRPTRVAGPARPGGPRRSHGGQRPRRRRRRDHRDRRLRRHEPLGARDRRGVGAGLAHRGPRWRRALPRGAPGPGRLPAPRAARARGAADPRRAVGRALRGHDRDHLVARSARLGGSRVRAAVQPGGPALDRDDPRHRVGGDGAAARRRDEPARRRRADRAAGRRVRSRAGAADLRAADPHGERERRLDDRRGGPPLPRHVQQRAVRGALASARGRGGRAAVAPAEHEPALPARDRDRAGRAPDRHLPTGPGHRPVRELRIGGERSRLAPGDDGDRQRRGPEHRPGVSRDLRGDRGALARDLACRRGARARRDLGPAGHLSRAASGHRRRSRRPSRASRPAGSRRRRRSSTGSSPATASATWTPPTCRSWSG